jgi:peroxiredoxin
MSRRTVFTAVVIVAVATAAFAIAFARPTDEKSISEALGKLRSMPDAERAKVTRDLALEIRALSAGPAKAGLASSLANLATEGDFGKDTLQEATTTLALALKESPIARKGEVAWPYIQLANLQRYEHMQVTLDAPDFTAAVEKIVKLESARAKVDFTLTDITGKSWTLSALKGKVVLVNFWATWCPPCRKEMPDLETLYNRFKDKGLVVLSISDEPMETVKPFISNAKYTFPVLLDPGRKVNAAYQIDGIPKNFIYDREGKLVAQSIDMRTERQFLEMLAAAGLK